MNGCLILNENQLLDTLADLCNSTLDDISTVAANKFKEGIKKLVNESPNQSQKNLIRKITTEVYQADDEYGDYLRSFLTPNDINELFVSEYTQNTADRPLNFDEAAAEKTRKRERNLIGSKFKDAPNAKLYFRRSIKNDMVESFLVRRSKGSETFFTTQEDMNQSVKDYKQELLNRVVAYFNNEKSLLKQKLPTIPYVMYDKKGNYAGIIEKIKSVINAHLDSNKSHLLDLKYSEYRDSLNPNRKQSAHLFLDAYNAWITLQNFDSIVEDIMGSVINITSKQHYNKHTGNLSKYEIKNRASNMWKSWTSTDDIGDMSEVISDVCQMLVETSKMYSWKNEVAYEDRYLSFNDFNHAIGLIKKWANDPISGTILLSDLKWENPASIYTTRISLDIIRRNKELGIYQLNANGESTGIPEAPTLKTLISRINENPQRYLHAIFDIICNTDLIKKFSLDDYQKNILWSLNKEIFGGSEMDPRSLYRLHTLTPKDNIYQILTQVAASTFPEDYMQYYETHNGEIGTRLLQDYAKDRIKRTIYENIKQSSTTLNPNDYSRLGIKVIDNPNSDKYLGKIQISLPITSTINGVSNFKFELSATSEDVIQTKYSPDQKKMIWQSPEYHKLVKSILGIDFNLDPDFRNAYVEVAGNHVKAVDNLNKLLGHVIYNSVVNNVYLPKHANINKPSNLKKFIIEQYGKDTGSKYEKGINIRTGAIPTLPIDKQDVLLGELSLAWAINHNLLAQAQSKTGEGTSIANYTLSRMRNFYHNQVEMQCKTERSAVRNLDFVVNSNNLFEGILSRRELKTTKTNQQSTKFSDQQSFQLAFINDFLSGFIPNPNDLNYLRNGKVSFLPTVNSDKPQIDGLLVNLYAESHIKKEDGTFKRFVELTDSEIEQEMELQFKPMYNRIFENVNTELGKVSDLLSKSGLIDSRKLQSALFLYSNSPILRNQVILQFINKAFAGNPAYGKKPKQRIINGLHKLLTEYNSTHSRNPIMLSPQVHYTFDDNGLLTSNKVLDALWGRFNSSKDPYTLSYLESLYANEIGYKAFLSRNGLTNRTNAESFFKWQDHLTVKDLLGMKFKIFLKGTSDKVRHTQEEIKFLRGEVTLTEAQQTDPRYAHIVVLNDEMKNWVDGHGYMVIAKGTIDGVERNITNLKELNQASNLRLHPMLSKLNRLDYLCSQQYTVSTVGSHYVHSGKPAAGQVLVEEARRWLASNKRNVAATSTVHLFQNKQLDGSPTYYNIAIMEDIREDLYTIMGDLYKEGHAPLDGGMIVNGFIPELENNSLAGEGAGTDKKHFGTFYSELYAAGGIIKTAGFAATNDRMRRQKAWKNLQRLMSSRPWVKEYSGSDGADVQEVIDITKDYLGRPIDYNKILKNQPVRYKRVSHNNPDEMAAYQLHHIESLGNNQYKIYEFEIDAHGNPISDVLIRQQSHRENGGIYYTDEIIINNNWDLFNEVFGGCDSVELGPNGILTESENSRRFMAYALNNVGYRKNFDSLLNEAETDEDRAKLQKHLETLKTGLDQDDVWLPLKHSDIHFTPNIGAIKSLQFNVNPDGNAVLEGTTVLNAFKIRLAQLGIQLDKEHHADASEVSMPTQIIQALANRSFTPYAKEVYKALETLTRQATQEFIDGVSDIITSNNPAKLTEAVTNLIINKLLDDNDEENTVNSILSDLLAKASEGKEIKYHEDIKGKMPWSDPTITSKLFSVLSTSLTSAAVKMNFAGTLSVICPAGKMEQIYGERTLNSFNPVVNQDGSTRTTTQEANFKSYQESVKNGNEVDSDGRNMLVYDSTRDIDPSDIDVTEEPENWEVLDSVHKMTVSTLLQENGFNRFTTLDSQELDEVITNALNNNGLEVTRQALQYVKNVAEIIKNSNISYDDFVGAYALNKAKALGLSDDFISELENIRALTQNGNYNENWTEILPYTKYKQNKLIIDYVFADIFDGNEYNKDKKGFEVAPSVLKAIDKAITLFKDINNTDTLNRLYDIVYTEASILPTPNIEKVREILVGQLKVNSIVQSNLLRKKLSKVAELKTQHNYIIEFADGSFEKVTINHPDDYYKVKNLVALGRKSVVDPTVTAAVTKIYENVIDGRNLSAYNVRFTNKNTDASETQRFQIFDLDSVNLLFKLNSLNTKKNVTGEGLFQELSVKRQQDILNTIFHNKAFNSDRINMEAIHYRLSEDYSYIPKFDSNFMKDLYQMYPITLDKDGKQVFPKEIIDIINKFVAIAKPRIYKLMQQDLFKLSDSYNKADRTVYANGQLIDPIDIQTDAYELIMPKIYKTQFGLQEFDDLQTILRDEDFFIKRGIQRFACKLQDANYDYELKNFNGNHVYILDKSKGVPEQLQQNLIPIEYDHIRNQIYRTDGHGKALYRLASTNDNVAEIGGVEVIITDNPLFYVQNFNYNTLKVSPTRVTDESYKALTDMLSVSKRTNAKNFIKAITGEAGLYDLATFKEFNKAIETITYENIKLDSSNKPEFKSVAQLCRILLDNGRELHTSFKESLNLIAGRIPAQSQQSFMTQKVIAFDNSDINTAMVSTFQLFLQGSDLDIDAVTLLGYAFDQNGKFIGWSPYFKILSKEMLKASKNIPLPTGQNIEINTSKEAPNNFFEIYDEFFGTLFKTISLTNNPNDKEAPIKTKKGVPVLKLEIDSDEGVALLAKFLRIANEKGINLKDELVNGKFNPSDENFYKAPDAIIDGKPVARGWNLFAELNISQEYTYQIAQQLLDIVNYHNQYINNAEEYLKDAMSKNYIVNYIYKVADSPCNQTEAMQSVDVSTKVLKDAAANSDMATESDYYAPGRTSAKVKSVGEGQAGKDGVGIGAVGIKANSTTQFYISELLNFGSEEDKKKILFKPKIIAGKSYSGFANMYTSKEVSDEERFQFEQVWKYIASLESEDQITNNVALDIAAMLSIAVDNAKDLALAKINSGPKLMGLYIYGMTLGVPVETLCSIINSKEGAILKELTEGSVFNNDVTAFKVLDVFDKLDGNFGSELSQFSMKVKDTGGKNIYINSNINVNNEPLGNISSTADILFAAMYENYLKWFDKYKDKLGRKAKPATTLNGMLRHFFSQPNYPHEKGYTAFKAVYEASKTNVNNLYIQLASNADPKSLENWIASMHQMVDFITDMSEKSRTFKKGKGSDLRVLAEGAEEMRILGSILSINKGLKASFSDAESFIDTIENLIYNRKEVLGMTPSIDDKIDFHKFMMDEEYQAEIIEEYEKVKHSVNIPHLISKAPHFKGYLKTQMIPTATFLTNSVKYRALHKYRSNARADSTLNTTTPFNTKPVSIFKLFNVDSKRDKDSIIKGLENLIQFKLFTRWAYDKKLQFRLPKGFKYFTRKVALDDIKGTNNDGLSIATGNELIPLWTEAGLATFKKYMEEYYIPQLQESNLGSNEFIKNLVKIENERTPIHNTVTTYSLPGDLMARNGRQAELNQRMFSDFKSLTTFDFQRDVPNGIPSIVDAFFIYSQYCYMGKKGQSSLINAFDYINSQHDLRSSFNTHVAQMDVNGSISCSEEEIIIWCAPVINQFSNAAYGYVTSVSSYGLQLKQKAKENKTLSEDDADAYEEYSQAMQDAYDSGEYGLSPIKESYIQYKKEYMSSHYSSLTKNYFLVPSTGRKIAFNQELTVTINGIPDIAVINIASDMISSLVFSEYTLENIDKVLKDQETPKYKDALEFQKILNQELNKIQIPYKVSLYTDNKRDIDYGILQNIIDVLLNC